MKIEYHNFGTMRLEAEDGRDNAWLCQMAENMKGAYAGILTNFFLFEDENNREMGIDEASTDTILTAVELNVFGNMCAPFDFAELRKAYLAEKPRIKEWLNLMWQKKDTRILHKDGFKWWNETFPDEQIK